MHKNYAILLSELFNRPASITWTINTRSFKEAHSTMKDNKKLEVFFEKEGASWECEFRVDGSKGKTEVGNQHEVFSTVIQAVKEFLEKYNPTELTFTAYKDPSNKKPESRIRLYTRMVKTLVDPKKWNVQILKKHGNDSLILYSITQKDV